MNKKYLIINYSNTQHHKVMNLLIYNSIIIGTFTGGLIGLCVRNYFFDCADDTTVYDLLSVACIVGTITANANALIDMNNKHSSNN